MASIAEIIEGLEILSKTSNVPKGLAEKGEKDKRTAHVGGASLDILYGPESDPDENDIVRLEKLGWHKCSDTGLWSRFV